MADPTLTALPNIKTEGDSTPAPAAISNETPAAVSADVDMADPILPHTESTLPIAPPTPSAAAAPTSARNSPHPTASQQAPTHATPHGSPTRVYLNQNVTPHLLEAMKHLATNEPEKPLKWLSEYLAQKSAEIEG